MTVAPPPPIAADAAVTVPETGQRLDRAAQALLAVAAAHGAQRAALRETTIRAIVAAWMQVVYTDLTRSWTSGISQRVYGYLSVAQELAAVEAASYVRRSLAAQGVDVPRPALNPRAFAGLAGDGRDLESLLVGAVVAAKRRVALGGSEAEAMASGAAYLTSVAATEISDAGRAADQVAIVVAKPNTGWIRVLTPPSCARCILLAGKFYKWSDGFQRHLMCWPAGTIVSGPEVLASSRRWYEGELVTVTSQFGENLSVTANHPILTGRGWVPAKFVKEGDEVFRSTFSQGATPLMVPNHQQMPARIENVFASLGVSRLFQVPATSEDFHGDGGNAEVDIVFSDRFLHDRRVTPARQHFEEKYFAFAGKSSNLLDRTSASAEALESVRKSTTSVVGFESLGLSLIDAHFGSPHLACLGTSSYGHICECKDFSHFSATDVNSFTDFKFAHARQVIGDDYLRIEGDGSGTRWNPSSDASAMQGSSTDTSRAFDLQKRLSGQIESDRVIKITRVQWSGHVYSLTTAEGWVCSNNLITSNCDCVHVAVSDRPNADDLTVNPYTYFKSLSKEDQDKYFGVAASKAIRDGADIHQVINARRGVTTADDGRRYTTSGTTRRGFYGRGGSRVRRPTPQQIYKDAKGDQAEAVRMLRRFGYIV